MALLIIFANNIIKSEKVNYIFENLGNISLPIYLFHKVIIELIDYVWVIYPKYIKYLIVFFSVLVFVLLYRIVENFLNKKLEERKENKEKEKDIISYKIN